MSEFAPVVTLAELYAMGVTIDSQTITAYLQIAFQPGYYTVGGVPAGIAAFLGGLTVNTSNPLWAAVMSEDPVVQNSATASGNFTYLYNFENDTIQIFDGPIAAENELTASEASPGGVLQDTIVGKFTFARIPR